MKFKLTDFDKEKIQKEIASLDEFEKKVIIAQNRRKLLGEILQLCEVYKEACSKRDLDKGKKGEVFFLREFKWILRLCEEVPIFALYLVDKGDSADSALRRYISQFSDESNFSNFLKEDIERIQKSVFSSRIESEISGLLKVEIGGQVNDYKNDGIALTSKDNVG